ncbi:unnamed protein product [Caenorhabditis nigoni]
MEAEQKRILEKKLEKERFKKQEKEKKRREEDERKMKKEAESPIQLPTPSRCQWKITIRDLQFAATLSVSTQTLFLF